MSGTAPEEGTASGDRGGGGWGKHEPLPLAWWDAAPFTAASGINELFTISCSQSLSKLPAGTLREPCV